MITANDIVKANEVLKNVVERTPLDFDRYLSEKYGATIYIKKENMQKVRSFKLRGAYYAIHQLSDEDKARWCGLCISRKPCSGGCLHL